MGVKDAVKQLLMNQLNKRYEKQLAARKISYDAWVREEESRCAVLSGTVGAQESGSGKTVGSCCDVVLLVQKDGRISLGALEAISSYFAMHPEVELLYGDEDLMRSDGTRVHPWYKPCWSPDLFASYFYFGSVIAVRKSLYEKMGEPIADQTGYIEFADALEIRDLVYRLVTEAGGFRKGCNTIGHVEAVLFHGEDDGIWQSYRHVPGISPEGVQTKNNGEAEGLISVIIPSKDNPEILTTCLQSLHLEKRNNMEVIVVDNGSTPENQAVVEANILNLKERIACAAESIPGEEGNTGGKISYLYQPMEFNFSHMCNLGAESATGRYLLFLNDDMEMCDNDWAEVMRKKASKEYVGAVGLKLYYPDSVRIQHAGIVNLPVGPVHKLQFMEDDRDFYFGRNKGALNCVAVTGACLMIEKAKFNEVGGFKESLRVAYNDVELGFALVEHGYQNVVVNERFGWHHESLSRGNDETKEKLRRLERERELLYELHPGFRGEDPYYPRGLNRQGLDSRVVPGYVTAKNTVQESRWTAFPYKLSELRRDECLMVRVESSGPDIIQGYSVVLGDNNACYDKYLVLLPERMKTETNPETVPCGGRDVAPDSPRYPKLEGQYRQDLEENLPDQVNVALGGFCVSRKGEQLPKGNYRIAVLAVHRISGLKLINESGKYLEVE